MFGTYYETNGRLWLGCSATIYLLFMLLWPLEGKLGGHPMGVLWLMLLFYLFHPDTIGVLVGLVGIFGPVSLAFGWVVQALLVIGISLWQSRRAAVDRGSGADSNPAPLKL